jgi:hypothetical protein
MSTIIHSFHFVNRTELELARWLGSHTAAVRSRLARPALAYLSYELFEKRFRGLQRLFETAKEAAPQRSAGAAGP